MSYRKATTTHQVPVSLTHSERQRHFSFWPEWLDLWFGHRNHSQPIMGEGWQKVESEVFLKPQINTGKRKQVVVVNFSCQSLMAVMEQAAGRLFCNTYLHVCCWWGGQDGGKVGVKNWSQLIKEVHLYFFLSKLRVHSTGQLLLIFHF